MKHQLTLSVFHELGISLKSLTLYRNILNDPVLSMLSALVGMLRKEAASPEDCIETYSSICHSLGRHSGRDGRIMPLSLYVAGLVLSDENPFSLCAEHMEYSLIDPEMKVQAKHDLDCIGRAANLDSTGVKQAILSRCKANSFIEANSFISDLIARLPSWNKKEHSAGKDDIPGYCSTSPGLGLYGFERLKSHLASDADWSSAAGDIARFHRVSGCGIFARHHAFIWERSVYGTEAGCSTGPNSPGILRPVLSPDPVSMSEFTGYSEQREDVLRNTQAFMKGIPANNILLYGDRGTGKSSTVKAIANEFASHGLRIIEVPKKYLLDFPHIISMLRGRTQRFILFVDDLAFEDNEENYTALKAALEGGVESKPENVVIYATSNRRHLVKEKFSDRAGLGSLNNEDEIRAADTLQEKLSLSDRFGMTVVFSSPDKSGYLEIVEGIARKRGISIESENLRKEALKWAMWYNGFSPRTAHQFIDWLCAAASGK